MKAINSELKRKMALAGGISFVMFGPTQFKAMFADHSMIPLSVAFLIGVSLMFSALPFGVEWGKQRAVRQALETDHWRESYKASPESHLLHLN
ncbi:hypothetical protein [Granulicella sp. dw_53]|uniref:hypothetical protein n=1 Tax=Granulicella sp. dw_53 TaxID=2719792 RepID=UPI001BD696BB|nr:hypothetical protein [Granulicella sp. dw_53]